MKEIEEAVLRLSATELAAFREWFADLDADIWDRQIAADAASGRLDSLVDEPLEDLRSGRSMDR